MYSLKLTGRPSTVMVARGKASPTKASSLASGPVVSTPRIAGAWFCCPVTVTLGVRSKRSRMFSTDGVLSNSSPLVTATEEEVSNTVRSTRSPVTMTGPSRSGLPCGSTRARSSATLPPAVKR